MLIRPLTLIGAIVIALALMSFLLIPGWRSSAGGILVLFACLGIGGYAIGKDLRDFWRDIKAKHEQEQKQDNPHP